MIISNKSENVFFHLFDLYNSARKQSVNVWYRKTYMDIMWYENIKWHINKVMWKVNYILLQTMKTDNKTDANCGAGRNCLFFRRYLNSPTGFCEIRFVPSLALLCAMFLSFFFLPLYCLSLFHSKNLITLLWYIKPFL